MPKRLILLAIACCLFSLQYRIAAAEISTEELLNNEQKYDGQEVVYKGEAVGDIMTRGENSWINLQDGTGTIGVFCPGDLLSGIKYTGSYKFKGDTVSARGIFHYSCPDHGGDTDIHGEKISIVAEGGPIEHPMDPRKVELSMILSGTAFILAMIFLLTRRFR